jgi:hypothetical protein
VGNHRIPFLGGSVAFLLAGSAFAATPAFASVRGNDDFGIAGSLVGTMTISKHHVFSDVSGGGVTDSGTWAKAKHERRSRLRSLVAVIPRMLGVFSAVPS